MPHGPRFKRIPLREAFGRARDADAVYEVRRRADVLARATVAATPRARARGLRGRESLAEGEGLVIEPCMHVHTFGMRFAIDAVFCDRKMRVVSIQRLDPGRLAKPVAKARLCIELPAGAAESCALEVGDELAIAPTPT